ncbi:MAG: hypothetical protein HY291_06370 [Planctomycetes bacterium]|nr:hypothetical protein [Planctomycetota bacterium]
MLLHNGEQVVANSIGPADFIACVEAYGTARKDSKVLYGLTEYCTKAKPEAAKRIAALAVRFDPEFHGDAEARIKELSDPAARIRKILQESSLFDPADEPKTGPRARLLECARRSPPNLAELKKIYLELQEARIFGEARLPTPPERKEPTVVERAVIFAEELAKEQPFLKLGDADAKSLKALFAESPGLREHFLLGLEPGYDFYQNAARVLLNIRAAFPKETAAYEGLALAFATTWDDPAVLKPHDVGIPELIEKPAAACKAEEAFGWYIKNQPKLNPVMMKTPWRLLAFVAADTGSIAERDWALQTYRYNSTLGRVYAEVQYDQGKLRDGVGKLAGHPYTLANLKTYGGVCRDQAFYARSVCRYFGMPSYWASGLGKTGGIGHAWVGWVIQLPSGAFQLTDYGRYADDKFFMATIRHPRSGESIFDYVLGLEARGLSNEKTYEDADLLCHVFEDIGSYLDPKSRYDLLVKAVKTNPFHRRAWLLIADGTAQGLVPQETALAQWEYLTAQFKDAPDFTFEVLSRFARMFKDVESEYKFFDAAAKMYVGFKRDDLAAKLRLEQVAACLRSKRKDIAYATAMKGMQEFAGVGKEGADLAAKVLALAKESNQLKQAVELVKGALARTQRMRGDEPNEYWIEMAQALRDAFRAVGDETAASRLDKDIESVNNAARR